MICRSDSGKYGSFKRTRRARHFDLYFVRHRWTVRDLRNENHVTKHSSCYVGATAANGGLCERSPRARRFDLQLVRHYYKVRNFKYKKPILKCRLCNASQVFRPIMRTTWVQNQKFRTRTKAVFKTVFIAKCFLRNV